MSGHVDSPRKITDPVAPRQFFQQHFVLFGHAEDPVELPHHCTFVRRPPAPFDEENGSPEERCCMLVRPVGRPERDVMLMQNLLSAPRFGDVLGQRCKLKLNNIEFPFAGEPADKLLHPGMMKFADIVRLPEKDAAHKLKPPECDKGQIPEKIPLNSFP